MSANYLELLAGSGPLVTTTGIFAAAQGVIPALTPLMLDPGTAADGDSAAVPGSGTLVPWDGQTVGKAIYVSAFEVDTASQTQAQVYKTGILNIDVLNWPESVTTTTAKMAAFAGSGISVQSLAIV